jgi:hypothetical protein
MDYGWTHAHIDAEIPKWNCGHARKNKKHRGEAKFPLVSTRQNQSKEVTQSIESDEISIAPYHRRESNSNLGCKKSNPIGF